MHNSKSKAFTLVELIVVIVILAILATIAFLSFSSQSASARDSTRLSDMSNIAKGLSVFNATAGSYPKPDNSISITASGVTIGQQGYAGASVLGMIKISNGGKDPLDTTTYYTYSVNSNSSKFQILGFLEDGSSSALSLVPREIPAFAGLTDIFADPASYSGRYVMTKGDALGILLQSGSMVPVQSQFNATSFTGVDLVKSTTSSGYAVVFSKSDTTSNITYTGSLFTLVYNKRIDLIKDKIMANNDSSLIGYWDMETTLSDGKLKDFSGKGNDGIGSGGIIIGGGEGQLGKGTYFDGSDDFINTKVLGITGDSTISVWVNNTSSYIQYTGGMQVVGDEHIGTPYGGRGILLMRATNNAREIIGGGNYYNVDGYPILSGWNNIVVTFKNSTNTGITYVNGIKVGNGTFSCCGNMTTSTRDFVMGGNVANAYNFKGLMDEVRVYNRALSESEVSGLYSSVR